MPLVRSNGSWHLSRQHEEIPAAHACIREQIDVLRSRHALQFRTKNGECDDRIASAQARTPRVDRPGKHTRSPGDAHDSRTERVSSMSRSALHRIYTCWTGKCRHRPPRKTPAPSEKYIHCNYKNMDIRMEYIVNLSDIGLNIRFLVLSFLESDIRYWKR